MSKSNKALTDVMIDLIEEAQRGMKKDTIYNTDNMQVVWLQFAKDCNSILISKDNGIIWEQPPSVDTGKWCYNNWLFKLK